MAGRADSAERLRRFAEAVRRARVAWSDTVATRDWEIYLARQAGLTVREIAKACAVSKTQIEYILADQASVAQKKPAADTNPGELSA